MINYNLDGVCFSLKSHHDFSWLKELGRVFAVFSQNDSGNISFGVNNGEEKYFVKAAGLNTPESVRSRDEAINALKAATQIYEDISHKSLIRLVKHFPLDDIYVSVFKWVDGECLFDYWNFEKYNGDNPSPAERFKRLPTSKRLKSADTLFSFLDATSKNGYVGVDFYDGSIMYDFERDRTTICDIDFFRKKPTVNDMGEDFWGTKRLKAPEEYILGAAIDEATNIFTLGALLLNNYFGNYTQDEVQLRYKQNRFTPCTFEKWELSRACYEVALKATRSNRTKRYKTIEDFYAAWSLALQNG